MFSSEGVGSKRGFAKRRIVLVRNTIHHHLNDTVLFQPLSDNLESSTYEVFEKDPVKYSEYHKAMYAALKDRLTDEEAAKGKVVNLMVLGAGRGPLVRAALKAGEQVCSSRLVFQRLTSKLIFHHLCFYVVLQLMSPWHTKSGAKTRETHRHGPVSCP